MIFIAYRSAFEEVRNNNMKSWLMIFLFLALVSCLGFFLGFIWDLPELGIIIAFSFALLYSLVAFSAGDSIVISATKARPVTKQEFPHFYHAVEGLAIAAGIPAPKAYVINDSALNAFATGRGPKKASIVVTTGLLEKMNRQELEGVIAHEMSHIKNNDIRTMMLAAVLVGVTILISDILLRTFLWGGMRNRNNRNSGGAVIALIAVGILFAILAPLVAQLIKLAISRKREFMADASGALLTRYPPGLASALAKIRADPDPLVDTANRATAHLFISTPFSNTKGFLVGLFSTHPPIEERIKRLKEM